MNKRPLTGMIGCTLFSAAAATFIGTSSSVSLAQSTETSSVTFLNGTWEGSYTCQQGLTKLRLDIQADSATEIDAVFSFSGHPTNPRNPAGSFRMRGRYEEPRTASVPSMINLDATTWISQPPGYTTVDLYGTPSRVTDSIVGSVNSDGCSTFEVKKTGTRTAIRAESNSQGTSPSEVDISNGARASRSPQRDGPESVVASFHQAIQDGDLNAIETHYCSAERVAAGVVEGGTDPNGRNRSFLDAYLQTAYALYSIDMSMLQYETVYTDDEGEGRAVVTVVGPVGVESPDGRGILIPYRNFSALRREWLRLIKENGEWKLCQNLDV